MAAAGASGLYVNPNTGAAQAGLAPFRNALINGDMRINQRGTSTNLASLTAVATASPGSWVTDRWNVLRSLYAAGAVMGQGTNLTTTDLPFTDAGIQTHARVGRNTTATDLLRLEYTMESQDSRKYAGKPITLSFYYRTGAGFSGSSVTASCISGTGPDQALRGTVTGYTNVINTTFSPSTSWTRVSVTGTCATTINQLFIGFYHTPIGSTSTNDHFDITGVQLELGSVATPFEVRPYPVELGLCMRYFERQATAVMMLFTSGNPTGGSTQNYGNIVYFKVTKRIAPILTAYVDSFPSNPNNFFGAPVGFHTITWQNVNLNTAFAKSSGTGLQYGAYDIEAEL